MPAPFSEDLRQRIIHQALTLKHNQRTIARNNLVSVRTVRRFVRLHRGGQGLAPRTSTGRKPAISPSEEEKLVLGILAKPTTTMEEVRQLLPGPKQPSLTTIRRCVKRLGFTRKRSYKIASQRDELHRSLFAAMMTEFHRKHFVFFDEMGADLNATTSRVAYSFRGLRLSQKVSLNRGKRFNLLATVTSKGPFLCKVTQGSVTGNDVTQFLTLVFIHMNPFPKPRSILILDNASIHLKDEINQLARSFGVLVFFLPTYSPDLNPIELCFGWVKSKLRLDGATIRSLLGEGLNFGLFLQEYFKSLPPRVVKRFMRHCGY